MNRSIAQMLLSTAILSATGGATGVSAQTAPPVTQEAEQSDITGDIVVTARRREESIQKVPVSVTAFSGDLLREKQIKLISDLTAISPGAVFISSGSSTNPTLTIRAQTKGYGPGLPAVVAYINEVPVPAYSSLLPTFDLSSVQVLKGPQGTLFGRNTNGGAVLAYTVAPTYDFNGYVEASYGNYDARELQGAVTIPIVDQHISLRLAADLIKRDGFVENLGPGHDLSDRNTRAYRGSLLIEPTDWLRNLTVVDYFRAHDTGPGNHIVWVAPPGRRFSDFFPALAPYFDCNVSASCDLELAFAEAQQLGPRKQVADGQPFSRQTIWGISNTTTAEIGDVTVKNIFGYRAVNFNLIYESDGTGLLVFRTPNRVGTQQFTDELQISGTAFDDRLTYIAGAFYLKDRPWGDNFLVVDLYRPSVVPESTLVAGETYYSARSTALFGQIGYELLDGLKLNAGFRYTWDRFSGCSTSSPYLGARVGYDGCRAGNGVTGLVKSSAPTWTLGLDYQVTPNIFTYVTSRRGYRGGGFNSPTFAPALASVQNFGPEKLTDVELGLKTNWRSGGMTGRFNIAAYRGAFRNIQQNVNVPVNLDGDNDPTNDPAGQTIIANGGKARIQGVEMDAMISPIPALSLSANAAYTDARYTDSGLPAILQATLGSSTFEYTPKWTYTLNARLKLPVAARAGEMVLSTEYYHSDSYLGQDLTIPAYHVMHATFDWNGPFGAPVDLSLFVRNIFDRNYIVAPGVATEGLGYFSAVYGDPRTYGLRLRYRFGE